MLPCCALGAVFLAQLLAVSRWINRVIFRRKPGEDERDYWMPERRGPMAKLGTAFGPARRRRILVAVALVEFALVVTVHRFGGFHLLFQVVAKATGTGFSAATAPSCCNFEKK